MFGYKARGKRTFPNMSTTHDVLTTHLMRSLMFHPIYRGWAPSAVSFTISQSFLPVAISFLLCFCKLFFQGNHRRSLDYFQFFDEFSQTFFVLLFLCFWCLCLLSILGQKVLVSS